MKKPNLTLSLAEAVRIIDQASAGSTPQLAIAVAATVLADFARQSLEPQPPVTTGNVVFTEIDHHKRTAVAVPVSQADLQKWQDIITLLTNDISLLLHTGALRMARHIDSLQIRLAEAEREVVRLEGELVTANAFIQDAGEHRLAGLDRVTEEQVPNDPPSEFVEWLVREMPPRTIISSAEWWAPRIWREARRNMRAALTAARGGG